MRTLVKQAIATAVLLGGCTGRIGDSGPGQGSGSDDGSEPGSGPDPGIGSSVDPAVAAADPTICVPGVPQTSQLPRLTSTQYDNTIRDLLGIEGQPSSMLAPDAPGSVDQRAWDGYRAAAESLALQVMTDETARAQTIPCTPSGDGADCALLLIQELGRRAFRRPLSDEEVTRFRTLFDQRAEITPSGTFDEAAELIIQSFLLSPSFLMRPEIADEREGDLIALSDYEVASRLSYMLWGSMPDETLFAAAAAGELSSAEQILLQAQRMLQDVKARSMVAAFHTHYLHMGEGTRWASIQRDPELFPAFDDTVVAALSAETERFLDSTVFDRGGTFQDLISSRVGFVNAALAPLYGLDPAAFGSELAEVELDPATRAGVFTRAGFLASHSLFDRSSPILRGAFLQKQILCTPIAAPPPDAESTPLPVEGQTNRERVDAQTAAAECAGCHHTLINPTGFALEAYDATGAYQEAEAFSGAPIDTRATVLIGEAAVDVSGPLDLMEKIASSAEAQTCYARHWVQFAYERPLTNEDSCVVENVAKKVSAGGYGVLSLIADLTQSDSFRLRAVPEVAP